LLGSLAEEHFKKGSTDFSYGFTTVHILCSDILLRIMLFIELRTPVRPTVPCRKYLTFHMSSSGVHSCPQ